MRPPAGRHRPGEPAVRPGHYGSTRAGRPRTAPALRQPQCPAKLRLRGKFRHMSQDEKLDEALKGTFPASDAFYLPPQSTASVADDPVRPHAELGLVDAEQVPTQG